MVKFRNLAQFFFSIELKWQLVNTPSFVMLACVCVATPRSPTIILNRDFYYGVWILPPTGTSPLGWSAFKYL